MPRLIDADELYMELVKMKDFGELTARKAIRVVENAPTIDAVPVVRCKDCIHNVANRKTDPMDITDYSGQDIVCDYFMTDGLNPNDYCSYAERKEE